MASDFKSDEYAEFKQRLKKSKKESTVDDNEGGISKKQIILYGAVVIVCFITIYPRMIHPMIKMALGYADPVKRADTDDIPPQMKMRGQPSPGSRPGMRPPPGARGEGGQHTESTKGSGGITGMILPVYAVGIVVYLLYTASKVYGSSGKTKKKKTDVHDEVYSLITEKLAGIDLEKVLCGEDVKGAEEINKLAEFLRGRNETEGSEMIDDLDTQEEPIIPQYATDGGRMSQKASVSESTEDDGNNIEELMRKCENKEPMSPEEMSRVQKRLLEMENRMSRLMASLNNVQQTSQLVAKEMGKTAATALESQHAEQSKAADSKDDLENDDSESQVSDESLPSMRESEIEEIYGQVDSDCSNISGDEASGDGEADANKRHENLRRRNVQSAAADSDMI